MTACPPPARTSGASPRLRRRALAALALAATLTATSPAVSPLASAQDIRAEGAVTAAAVVAGTVTIDGTPASGQTVTAGTADWSPPETSFSYAWSVDGSPVGADAPTLLVDPAWVGGSLTVTVIGTAPDTTVATATSDPVAVQPGVFAAPPAPTVTGAARVGGTLTAAAGTWSPSATFAYQWRRNGGAIAGAVGSSYVPVVADKGATVSVVVTGSAPGYTPRTGPPSAGVVVGAGAFSAAPVPRIQGAAVVGTTLKAVPGTWSPVATLTYRWLRNGVPILGATAAGYRVTETDHADRIAVRVTGTRPGFATVVRTSAATAVVTRPFAAAPSPWITGTQRVGATLTANVRAWSPTVVLTFQWKRNGIAIPGATARTYRLGGPDWQKVLTVTVTGRKAGYAVTSRTSAGTARILKPAPTLTRDGVFAVGTQIPAGTYVTGQTHECYWERRSNDRALDPVGELGWDAAWGQRIVTIKPTDTFFYTDGCGAWTRLYVLGPPRSQVVDGMYAVRNHIAPGLWSASGSATGCYWARLNAFTGQWERVVIDDGYTEAGGPTVRIGATDVGFDTLGCGTWSRIGD